MQTRYTSADQWAEAKDGVIPAPYALEEGEQIIDQYLEPVIFHNVNGPDIGVTTCGVIVKDGLYFKDLDNSGELAPYKDWRLSPEQRAEDMVKHLRLDQQAGLVLNTLFNSPVVPTRAEATNAEGKLELGKIYKHHNPGEKPMPGPLPGGNRHSSPIPLIWSSHSHAGRRPCVGWGCPHYGISLQNKRGLTVQGRNENSCETTSSSVSRSRY